MRVEVAMSDAVTLDELQMRVPNGEKMNLLGEGAAFHHLGIAVEQIRDAELEKYADPIQKCTVAFADIHGLSIELIEPAAPDAPIVNQLKKKNVLVHVCYSVPDIMVAIEQARKNGFLLLAEPVPAVAFEGSLIAWLYHGQLGLFELVETSSDEMSATPPQPCDATEFGGTDVGV